RMRKGIEKRGDWQKTSPTRGSLGGLSDTLNSKGRAGQQPAATDRRRKVAASTNDSGQHQCSVPRSIPEAAKRASIVTSSPLRQRQRSGWFKIENKRLPKICQSTVTNRNS